MFFWIFLFLSIIPVQAQLSGSPQKFIDINVKETAGLDVQRSVTGGVPIAEETAPAGSKFILLDKNNKPVPTQSDVLAT